MTKQTVQHVEEHTTELVVKKTSVFKQKAFLVGTAVGVALTSVAVAVLTKKTGRVEIETISDAPEDSSTD